MYIYGVHEYVFMSGKLCMHMSVYVYMCVSKFIHMYEGQRVELDILLNCSTLFTRINEAASLAEHKIHSFLASKGTLIDVADIKVHAHTNTNKTFKNYVMCMGMFCQHMSLHHVCMVVSLQARRRCQIPWD